MKILPKNRTIHATGVLLAVVALTGLMATARDGSERVERSVRTMGTVLTVVVEASTRDAALAASDAAVTAIEAAEARLSTWTNASELSRFNAAPAGSPVELTPELARDLAGALRCRAATGGAFSPGVGRLVEAWNLRGGGRQPTDEELDDLLPALQRDGLNLEGTRATRLDDAFVVEEGGFGKGVGLDDAAARLRETEAVAALLDFGGQVHVWGDTRAAVDLADPRNRDRVVLRFDVTAGSVATSGNSERGIRAADRRLGHLLDPRTARPAADFGSVAVWSPRAAEADCLSTGLYVMGPEEAARWAARNAGVGVVLIESTGERLTARASASLRGRLHALVDDIDLQWIETRP